MSKSMSTYFCITDMDVALIFSLFQVLYLIKENFPSKQELLHFANDNIIKKGLVTKQKAYKFIKQSFVTAIVTLTEREIKKP